MWHQTPPRRVDAHALRAVKGGRANDFLGDDLVLEDLLVVVDVVDEVVERVDALFEPALDPLPLLGAHDAGDQVERKNALRAGGVAVDVEGDAHLQQQTLGGTLAAQQLPVFERLNGLEQQAGFRPDLAAGVEHLVMKTISLIGVEPH